MKITNGTIADPKGFYADGLHCGLKHKKKDIGWIYSEVPAQAAGVFTTNQIKAAPVYVTKEALEDHQLQAIIVNSAIANACTGEEGLEAAKKTQSLVAKKLGLSSQAVAVASTGVIGKSLPIDIMAEGIYQLQIKNGNAKGFHEAILTTDLKTKEITVEREIEGKKVTVAGVAKGSGMIHPNMATMLSFITTDATISGELLQQILKEVTDVTYNQITVDGDTSTNDMVLIMANGCSGVEEIKQGRNAYSLFKEMVQVVARQLAKDIARDGEGATKLIEVTVTHGKTEEAAKRIAKKIVGSSLVKSAMFGEDPNWGRIICAVGYAEEEINPEKIDMWLGSEQVMAKSQPLSFDETQMKYILEQDTIEILVQLNIGDQKGQAWGCDLTYKYVEINACYHT